MTGLRYAPGVFECDTEDQAKAIILTPEAGVSPATRWAKETPYLADLIGPQTGVLLDYGCGIGRMAKAVLERSPGITEVIGVDQSVSMRTMAPRYVDDPRLTVLSHDSLKYVQGSADAAIAVWVLQHCVGPAVDLARIRDILKPGAILHVVNDFERAVPVTGGWWFRDAQNIRRLCATVFGEPEHYQTLDPAFVVPGDRSFYARYRRA